ncbi:MAG TPA: hypothetical protein VLM89_11630 [Phycisphaerae bacterium]|nr:hypothetical protein [Phycisphaerae bacterium]
MTRPVYARRGFVMALVLAVMSLVAGVLALLASYSAAYYRNHQAERLKLATEAACASVAAYARAHAAEWAARPPASPVSPDIAALMPPGATGSVTISLTPADHHLRGNLSIRLTQGRYAVEREINLDFAAARARPELQPS